MARAIWSGAISFGLVSIPVELYSATEDHTVHFNQFQRGTSDRIRYKRVNERTGKEVDYSDIVKGNEVDSGEFVLVEPDELADIAPGRSRAIEIDAFVELDEIDPIHYQKTYWLAPAKKEYAKPYALLTKAMADSNRAGIATFVMRGKQYLTAIRPRGKIMALETLFFADEIRDPAEITETVADVRVGKGNELKMATTLIESMSQPWRPEDYHDTYAEKVNKLIDDKAKGNETVVEAEPPDATEVTDLMEALRRSVESTSGKTSSGKTSGGKSGGGKSNDGKSAGNKPSSGKSDSGKSDRGKSDSGKSAGSKASSGKSGDSKAGNGKSADRKASGSKSSGSGKKPSGGEKTEATKAELTERAKDLDIRGRSKMTRDELEKAIAKAS
ncbi:Ku protein [Kibdelosporangium phytohabitans]|uniref:Non-homologous end joining protein Ku n=1 Tax=Kibdelosporangium phytohabitans TaxID=860235 RepID=A0A0N9I901_9PSEU|nr:Ku protein [Kibdelosporangium phytohabitans]ALG11379.1 DNA repair protein [Kibdelosporangium phytohabitans]MBE1462703.1 DNA end-binding protein Ku [Kibdelosporangium phytohabitans]